MNPFTGKLNRIGFLIWSILLVPIFSFTALLSLGASLSEEPGSSDLFLVIAVAGFILYMVVVMRRLQDTGLSLFLMILFVFMPITSVILFFLPSRSQTSR